MDPVTYQDVVQRWSELKIESTDALDTVLYDFRILFAYHSNRIENAGVSLHETREIFENGKVIDYTGNLRALFETENQRVCYEYLKDKIVNKEKLSQELIRGIQERLCHGCYDESRWKQGERPGEYKKHYYGVGDEIGVPPEDVPSEVQFICDQVNEIPGLPGSSAPQVNTTGEMGGQNQISGWEPGLDSEAVSRILTAAAYFHCNFESIHPFADGNGRTGRTLLNYVLLVGGLPPLIIYEQDKKLYYEALAVFDHTEKLNGFVQFMKEETVKTWTRKKRNGDTFLTLG